MRRIFCTSIAIIIIFFSGAGCHMLEKMYLESPTKASPKGLQEFKQHTIANEIIADSVQDMMQRIEVQCSVDVTNKNIVPIVQNCLSFLAREFGHPVYRGRVCLVITDDPSDNAYITWREDDDRERQITLNHYNVLKPMWHHYLLHELFHAFYQSSEFLRVNPDSIIEGLAIYAQYKYQNQEMSIDQLREKISEDAVALRPYTNGGCIDFNRPFESYGEAQKKYIYLVCGLLFFNQDPETIQEKIRKLLWSPPFSEEKMPFERIVRLYDLGIEDEMFEQGEKTELALPAPKKYTDDPSENSRYFMKTADTPSYLQDSFMSKECLGTDEYEH